MSYNIRHNVRVKDLKALAERITEVTDDLSGRVEDLEKLAYSLKDIVNSVITNIERTD